MTDPRTEAGRALLGPKTHVVMDDAWYRLRDDILAIEAEAAEKALREAVDRVRALVVTGTCGDVGDKVRDRAILAILDPDPQP